MIDPVALEMMKRKEQEREKRRKQIFDRIGELNDHLLKVGDTDGLVLFANLQLALIAGIDGLR